MWFVSRRSRPSGKTWTWRRSNASALKPTGSPHASKRAIAAGNGSYFAKVSSRPGCLWHRHAQSDTEGRVIRLDFGDRTLINAYSPSGTTGEVRQGYKYQWLDEFMGFLSDPLRERPRVIVCGDYTSPTGRSTSTTQKGIRSPPAFSPKNGPGWTASSKAGF